MPLLSSKLMKQVSFTDNANISVFYYILIISCVAPSVPVQNVVVSNVNDSDDITVFIEWNPPTDPNGIIRYYRVQFMQVLDPLDDGDDGSSDDGSGGRRKRNIPLDVTVMNVFVNITDGSDGAPTNITLRGLCYYCIQSVNNIIYTLTAIHTTG